MIELIAIIVLLISAIGIGIILYRKIPILVELPEVLLEKRVPFGLKLKKKIKELNVFKNFSYEIFLQKLIFRVRILTLKIEHLTFNWLQKLRERAKRKKSSIFFTGKKSGEEKKIKREDEDGYWEELKKIKKEK